MPLKVLQIVVSNTQENSNIITGPERRTANLAGYWSKYNIEPIICYPEYGSLKSYFLNAGLKVIPFELKSKFDIKAIFTLRKIIKENEIQLVHTQGAAALDMIATIAAKMEGIKMMVTRPVMISDQIHYAPWRRKLYGIIDKKITMKYSDLIVAVSTNGFNVLQESYQLNREKLKRIYNGVDAKRFPVKKNKKFKRGSTIRIGMVAHLSQFKGWFDFIDVIRMIKEKSSIPIKGIIIGKGVLEVEIKRKVSSLKLEKDIEFTGFTDNVSQYLQTLDIFLFTSHREGLSVAILEAMFSGLPIVATEVGGIREQIIPGKNGFIQPVGDTKAMSDNCLLLIKNEPLRKTMSEFSRELALERFSEKNMLESYVACYHSLTTG